MRAAGASQPIRIGALATAHANAPTDQQRVMLGENLYPLVDQLEHDQAAKVTGMLLKMALLGWSFSARLQGYFTEPTNFPVQPPKLTWLVVSGFFSACFQPVTPGKQCRPLEARITTRGRRRDGDRHKERGDGTREIHRVGWQRCRHVEAMQRRDRAEALPPPAATRGSSGGFDHGIQRWLRPWDPTAASTMRASCDRGIQRRRRRRRWDLAAEAQRQRPGFSDRDRDNEIPIPDLIQYLVGFVFWYFYESKPIRTCVDFVVLIGFLAGSLFWNFGEIKRELVLSLNVISSPKHWNVGFFDSPVIFSARYNTPVGIYR